MLSPHQHTGSTVIHPQAYNDTIPLMCAPVTNPTKQSTSALIHGRFRRVPCKARGMKADHNKKTAYFDIPVDAKHGMLLVCSHHGCLESGRSFCYCAVCELPVAKRNFCKRHAHGLPVRSRSNHAIAESAVVDTAVPPATNAHPCHTSYDSTRKFYEAELQNMAEQAMPMPNKVNLPLVAAVPSPPSMLLPNTAKCLSDTTLSLLPAPAESSSGLMKVNLNPTEFQWLALLHNRPQIQDVEATKKWIEDVFTISELNLKKYPSVTPPLSSDSEVSDEPTPVNVEPTTVMAAPGVSLETPVAAGPMTLDQQVCAQNAEIQSGLALAAAASMAAEMVPDANEEMEPNQPPVKRQRTSDQDKIAVLPGWT